MKPCIFVIFQGGGVPDHLPHPLNLFALYSHRHGLFPMQKVSNSHIMYLYLFHFNVYENVVYLQIIDKYLIYM